VTERDYGLAQFFRVYLLFHFHTVHVFQLGRLPGLTSANTASDRYCRANAAYNANTSPALVTGMGRGDTVDVRATALFGTWQMRSCYGYGNPEPALGGYHPESPHRSGMLHISENSI
jgi:hypothetical protein